MKTVVSAANSTSPANAASSIVVPKTEPVTTDDNLEFTSPNKTSTAGVKRPGFLDLKLPAKNKCGMQLLLTDSPDTQTVNTPDLEKFLLSSNLMQTPQPGALFPTKVGAVTSEQEEFGKGFEVALQNLHSNSQAFPPVSNSATGTAVGAAAAPLATTTTVLTASVNNGISGGTFTYEGGFPVIKDEPQNTAASPTVSPIDMETQEKIKLERKRQRNRVAASKCRKRKLERISKLEDRVKVLKGENTDLAGIVKSLKDHVAQLKKQVIEHMEAGCVVQSVPNALLLAGK